MIGSALCGTAENITQLGIYRAIQGIGGGALVPIAFTIVFDIFPPEKRGKMGGLFGRYLDYLVFSGHYLAHILPTTLAGTGYFILTYHLAF